MGLLRPHLAGVTTCHYPPNKRIKMSRSKELEQYIAIIDELHAHADKQVELVIKAARIVETITDADELAIVSSRVNRYMEYANKKMEML